MVKTITIFEIRNGFRRLSTYIYFALFFALGYVTFIVAAGAFPGVDVGFGAGGKLYANSAFMLFALISSTSFYGLLVLAAVMGNAAHQDFRHNTFPLIFTSPVSKMQYLGGRFLAANVILLFIFSGIGIACFVAGLLLVVICTGMVIQAAQGYFNYEMNVYLRDLFGIQFVNLAILSILAMFVQVLVNHKYLGHFVMVLFFLGSAFLASMGWDHHLYRYGTGPGYMYSDMNDFGHFLFALRWFQIYWALSAILLAAFAVVPSSKLLGELRYKRLATRSKTVGRSCDFRTKNSMNHCVTLSRSTPIPESPL